MKKDSQRPRRGRLLDQACLVAVGVVVVLVSLPRLRDLALRDNELDAVHFARHLAVLAAEHPVAADVGQLVRDDPERRRSMRDAALLRDGALLRRRGYLFDVVLEGRGTVVRAWPWKFGATGLGAFLVLPQGELLGHPNDTHSWSGPSHPPDPLTDEARALAARWRPLDRHPGR